MMGFSCRGWQWTTPFFVRTCALARGSDQRTWTAAAAAITRSLFFVHHRSHHVCVCYLVLCR